jgi:hypothetical protein
MTKAKLSLTLKGDGEDVRTRFGPNRGAMQAAEKLEGTLMLVDPRQVRKPAGRFPEGEFLAGRTRYVYENAGPDLSPGGIIACKSFGSNGLREIREKTGEWRAFAL